MRQSVAEAVATGKRAGDALVEEYRFESDEGLDERAAEYQMATSQEPDEYSLRGCVMISQRIRNL